MILKEKDIRRQILTYLRHKKWFVYHNIGAMGCYAGASDLVALKNGRTVWIEVETGTGRQSTAQKQFQQDIERAGGTYLLARGLDDITRWELQTSW